MLKRCFGSFYSTTSSSVKISMENTVSRFKEEANAFRLGRATPALLESLTVTVSLSFYAKTMFKPVSSIH